VKQRKKKLMKKHANVIPGVAAALTAAFVSVPALAQDATPVATPTVSTRISRAKTIRGTVKFNLAAPDGKFTPLFDITVTVAGPNRFRAKARSSYRLPSTFTMAKSSTNTIAGEVSIKSRTRQSRASPCFPI
jgi:hypothetical protein